MTLILQKPTILCDSSGNFKSWNYLKYKLFYDKIQSPQDIICLPVVMIICTLVSFLVAKSLVQSN